MRADPDYLRWSVAFIIGEHGDPIGTGFFVHLPVHVDRAPWVLYPTYLVTAAHVVRRSRKTAVRVHRKTKGIRVDWGVPASGAVEDIPVPRGGWCLSDDPGIDIAVAPVNISDRDYWYVAVEGQTKGEEGDILEFPWVSSWETRGVNRSIAIGDRVFFIGLLAYVSRMWDENIPMARGGTLGALWQRGIPTKLTDDTTIRVTGHLIDCMAYRGFSGSPVFVHRKVGMLQEKKPFLSMGQRDRGVEYEHVEEDQSPFLGIYTGHFPYHEKVGPEKNTLPVNAGVGVVMPCQYLWRILGEEPFVSDRKKRIERFEKESEKEEGPGAAVPDSVRPGPEPERLKLDEEWGDAVEKALRKKKPKEGWPEDDDA